MFPDVFGMALPLARSPPPSPPRVALPLARAHACSGRLAAATSQHSGSTRLQGAQESKQKAAGRTHKIRGRWSLLLFPDPLSSPPLPPDITKEKGRSAFVKTSKGKRKRECCPKTSKARTPPCLIQTGRGPTFIVLGGVFGSSFQFSPSRN